jgi:hypothetical protein
MKIKLFFTTIFSILVLNNSFTSYAAFPVRHEKNTTAIYPTGEKTETTRRRVITADHMGGDGGGGMSIASMVCGILSILLVADLGGIWLGIPAIVFGVIGLRRQARTGMAIAGIICGAISLLITIIAIIFIAAFFAALI